MLAKDVARTTGGGSARHGEGGKVGLNGHITFPIFETNICRLKQT
jgi:hypothetical protein